MKLSYYLIEWLLFFLKLLAICTYSKRAKNSVNDKNSDSRRNCPIISIQNAWNQCKVQKYNESKQLFYWITTNFAGIECQLHLH